MQFSSRLFYIVVHILVIAWISKTDRPEPSLHQQHFQCVSKHFGLEKQTISKPFGKRLHHQLVLSSQSFLKKIYFMWAFWTFKDNCYYHWYSRMSPTFKHLPRKDSLMRDKKKKLYSTQFKVNLQRIFWLKKNILAEMIPDCIRHVWTVSQLCDLFHWVLASALNFSIKLTPHEEVCGDRVRTPGREFRWNSHELTLRSWNPTWILHIDIKVIHEGQIDVRRILGVTQHRDLLSFELLFLQETVLKQSFNFELQVQR